LATGRKTESYFPVAVADNKFHCIILKGGDRYPYFPRPLLSEFDFAVPLTSASAGEPKKKKKKVSTQTDEDDVFGEAEEEDEDDEEEEGEEEVVDAETAETLRLTQTFLLTSLQAAQLADAVDSLSSSASHKQRSTLARLELDTDKTLLQLLAIECRAGDDRGMRALELVRLMRDRSGRMLEAAGKVAERYGRGLLGEKIREVAERRVAGRMDDDDDADSDFS
jgi:chromosome transmission fidelity protein 4